MKFFSAFLLILAVAAFSAPVKKQAQYTAGSAKVVGAVESKVAFSGDRLFGVLDSVGGAGTWMEWDINGVKDPSLMDVLNPMLSGANKPEMVWVITERSKPLVAVLLPKGNGEVILFYELNSLNAKPEPLSVNPVLSPDVVLRDYRQISETEYVHRDRETLKVTLLPKGMRFTYEKRGEEPLRMESNFSTKTFAEKQSIIRDYENYFKYEYSLMLRAFVQSTRGVFNWQAWHWYMPEWNAKFLMSKRELEAILVRGVAPSMWTLFKTKTAHGETVELKCNGNGFWELDVIGL